MKLRVIQLLWVALAAVFSLSASSPREKINFNKSWRFSYGDIENAEKSDFDDSSWVIVNLPHDYQISQPWVAPGKDEKADMDNPVANVKSRLSSRGFKEMGTGWYRKTFDADPSWKGKRVLADFEGIMLVGDVYLNGEKIGSTDYGYLGFDSDISGKLRYDAPNVLAVRADTGKPENSRWYTGGGLYRDVNLVVTDKDLYFTRHPFYITTPEVSPEKATVLLQAEIANLKGKENTMKVRTEIKDADGTVVYDKVSEFPFNRKMRVNEHRIDSVTLENPRLWDTEDPHLYTATFTLYRPDGSEADRLDQRFGVRKIEFSPEFGFKLNGRKLLLKGNANHHTLGALGAAAYPRAMEKRIKLLKDFGFNHIRSSHNPYSESFLDLCDENGIIVVDELYDKWLTQYAGGRRDWMEQWPNDLPEWVKRDRNHPSVIMWSLGNELQLLWDIPYHDWGVTPYRMQKQLLKRFDTTRPLTVAMHPRGRNLETDSIPADLALETDVASYNYRYMYFPGDSKRYPWMMFYQSEANTSNMGPNFFDMDRDKVLGLAYWGMIDYLGESQGWPDKGWKEGVFDISLEPKPNAYFLKSYYKDDEPMVHIAVFEDEAVRMWNDVAMGGKRLSDHWNYKPGSELKLYTYTNADEVELKINGKSLGRKRNNRENSKERNRIIWDKVPYSEGKIEAVAYNDGVRTPVATTKVETAGKAVKLGATGDNPDWKADGTDLQHVRIEALDSKNRRNPHASDLLEFSVEGPAEIVGVINGNHTSDELYTGNTRPLYNGTATVILRSKDEPGIVTLTVKGDGYKPVKKEMKLK